MLVYTSFNLPLVIWMMQPFFDTVPVSLEEAALVDGARTRTVFTKIVLPMVTPGIAATAILYFLYAWNDFFFALIQTRANEPIRASLAQFGLPQPPSFPFAYASAYASSPVDRSSLNRT